MTTTTQQYHNHNNIIVNSLCKLDSHYIYTISS